MQEAALSIGMLELGIGGLLFVLLVAMTLLSNPPTIWVEKLKDEKKPKDR
ncbi:MAG: hypothetical protein ACK5AZ_17440 [Bryobacteraceae bacterium]